MSRPNAQYFVHLSYEALNAYAGAFRWEKNDRAFLIAVD